MSLFDPNTVAVVDDIPDNNGVVKAPEETGEAMKPHDPANVLDSQDDVINLDKVLDDQDVDESVGSDSIFNYNQSVATPSNEDIREDLSVPKKISKEDAFNSFFAGLESSLVTYETGVNPEITSADYNPQMAVIPLKDPTITKTSDDIKDQFGVHLENDIDQVDDVVPFDEQNAYNVINNIRSISQESLLPIHAEDGVTYADIVQDEKYVNTYSAALSDAEERISDIKSQIEETGGIDKTMVLALENIQPGIITRSLSLESFTAYPTKTNLVASLEAADGWVVGAKVLGGAVIFGLIVKMLLWIRDKLNGKVAISDKEISAAKERKDYILKDINDIATKDIDVIRTNPTIVKKINERCRALLKSDRYEVKLNNIAEANNVFLQQYTHAEFKNFSKLHGLIVTNKNINGGMASMAKFLNTKLRELEVKFTNYEGAFRSTNMMDPAQYNTDWSEAGDILKQLGFDYKPKNEQKLGDYLRGEVSAMSKTHEAIPTYQTLAANSYSPDNANGLDEVKKGIETLLKKVTKLSQDHTTFPDKEIGNNRQQIGTILQSEVNNLLGVAISAISMRNTGNAVSKKLVNVVNKTHAAWVDIFKGTPIKYGKS